MLVCSLCLQIIFVSNASAKQQSKSSHTPNGVLIRSLQVVKKEYPDFRVLLPAAFSQSVITLLKGVHPARVLGDFNGDQKKDVAVYGYSVTSKKLLILVVISQPAGAPRRLLKVREVPFEDKKELTSLEDYISLGDHRTIANNSRDTVQLETHTPSWNNVIPFYFSLRDQKMKPLIDGQGMD